MEAEKQGPPATAAAHSSHPPRTFTRRIDCTPQQPVAPAADGGGPAADTQEGA